MIQYSVYVRVCVSRQSATFMENRIKDFMADEGLLQTMMVTEKQYNLMLLVIGKKKEDVRNSAKRTVVL